MNIEIKNTISNPKFIKIIPKSEFNYSNTNLKNKTGSEILKMFNIDFVNSEIAKGISDMDFNYMPDFGYEDQIQFGDNISK